MFLQEAGSRLDAQEQRRRADIARRYVAIGSPTKADDQAYARELGLSVDSLWRLARTWRLAAETAERPEADPIAARRLALEAARDPDLSRVSPSRRPLVQERLRVIARHLSKDEATARDVDEAAAELDLTAYSFRRLLRGWIQHRNPALLHGGSTSIRNARNGPKNVGSREEPFARALATMGPRVSAQAFHDEVVRLCEADGIKPPCLITAYHRLMRARAKAPPSEEWTGFGLDHSAVALAVASEGGGSPTLPVLSLLFAMRSGRIVAHSLSLDPPAPLSAAELLMRSIEHLPPGNEPLTLGIPEEPDWQRLHVAVIAAGVETAPISNGRPVSRFGWLSAGRLIKLRFGDVLGTLRFRSGKTRHPARTALTRVMGSNAPLTFEQAIAAVDDVVRLHNEGRDEPTTGFVPHRSAPELGSALERFVRQEG